MQRYFLLSSLLLFVVSVFGQNTRTVRNYYDPYSKDHLKEVYTVTARTGQKHGTYKYFSEKGPLLEKARFHKGELHGKKISYQDRRGKYCGGKPAIITRFDHGQQDGVHKKYWCFNDGRQLHQKKVFETGDLVESVEYSRDGSLKKKDQKNGPGKEMHENGQVKAQWNSKDYRHHGTYKEWYKNGQLKAEGTYENGGKEGTWEYFHKNGELRKEETYSEKFDLWMSRDEEFAKTFKRYNKAGKLVEEKESLSDTTCKVVKYSPETENKVREVVFGYFSDRDDHLDTLKDGKLVEWYPDGTKKVERPYVTIHDRGRWRSFKDGVVKTYHKNGELKAKIPYEKGEKHGRKLLKYANGQKSAEGEFKDGKKVGKWTYWFKSGQKQIEGKHHEDGDQYGKWRVWHENGQLKRLVEYEDGSKTGIEKQFDKNGELVKVLEHTIHGEKEVPVEEYKRERAKETYRRLQDSVKVQKKKVTDAYIEEREVMGFSADKTKKKDLYQAFEVLETDLRDKIDESRSWIKDVKYQRSLLKLYDRMLELKDQDTKGLEEELDGVDDHQKVRELLDI